MERRTKLLILILVALVILGFGIWLLLTPLLQTPPTQPPSLPSSIQPSTSVPSSTQIGQTSFGTVTSSGAAVPLQVKQLGDLASVIVARIGSGTSREGFRGYADVLVNATSAYQERLKQDRLTMQRLHPVSGSQYGMVSRVVSVNTSKASTGAEKNVFTLQVQKAEDAGNPGQPTKVSYLEATVTFVRQADGSYLVDDIVWKDIVL
jgi:cytoskeletal protein RodZ